MSHNTTASGLEVVGPSEFTFHEGYEYLDLYDKCYGFENHPNAENRVAYHGTWMSPSSLANGAAKNGYERHTMVIPRQPLHVNRKGGEYVEHGDARVSVGQLTAAAARGFFHDKSPVLAQMDTHQGYVCADFYDTALELFTVVPRQAAHCLTPHSTAFCYALPVIEGRFRMPASSDIAETKYQKGEHISEVCVRPAAAFLLQLADISDDIIVTDATADELIELAYEMEIYRPLATIGLSRKIEGAEELAEFMDSKAPSQTLTAYFK